MRQTTIKRADVIEYKFWLTFDRDGSMRFSRNEPGVTADQRAMSCTAVLPRSLFSTPTLRATIDVIGPEPTALQFNVQTVSEALKQAIGVDVDLRITEEPRT